MALVEQTGFNDLSKLAERGIDIAALARLGYLHQPNLERNQLRQPQRQRQRQLQLSPPAYVPTAPAREEPLPAYSSSLDDVVATSETATEPISLCIDGVLIYAPPPSSASYTLSFPLDEYSNYVKLSRTVGGQERKIYKIVRDEASGLSSFKIYGNESAKVTRAEMHVRFSHIVPFWQCKSESRVCLTAASKNWKDALGRIVAWEENTPQRRSKKPAALSNRPLLHIQPGLDPKTVDLIVCCWVTKTWFNATLNMSRSFIKRYFL